MKTSRWMTIGVALAAILAGGVVALRLSPLGAQGAVAAGYGARTACACRYLGNRSLASCRTDFEPGMELVRLSEDAAAKRITAAVPLIAARSARFEPDYGCTLEE
jgi:hypothetical protein